MSIAESLRNPTVRKGAVIGVVAGFLSGVFGVGGGILIVPALVLVAGYEQRLAHGTSLAAVLPIATSGLIGFAVQDSVDWVAAVLLIAGSVLGAVVGTRLLQILPVRTLAIGFIAVLLATAAQLVLSSPEGVGRGELTLAAGVGMALLGLGSGTLAGLLGVGGGVVMVPGMVLLFGMPAAVAKGTSLAVIIPTALTATRRNLKVGNADLVAAAAIGVSGMLTALLASRLSVAMSEDTANSLFAVLLVVLAGRMALSLRSASEH
jgi:uncharacterized membrane protein YfcA